MSDVPTLVYDLALRSLDQQERELADLRARTNTLIAASALIASFLGAAAIDRSDGASAHIDFPAALSSDQRPSGCPRWAPPGRTLDAGRAHLQLAG